MTYYSLTWGIMDQMTSKVNWVRHPVYMTDAEYEKVLSRWINGGKITWSEFNRLTNTARRKGIDLDDL